MILQNNKIVLRGFSIPFCTRIHQKAKRFILRYDSVHNIIKLTVPPFYKNCDVYAFMEKSQAWLEKQVFAHKTYFEKKESLPTHLMILGQHTSLIFKQGTKYHVWQEPNSLIIRCPEKMEIFSVKRYIQTVAIQYFTQKSSEFSLETGKEILKISIGDAKTRWGSCSSTGRLTFSWRLMLAPHVVADYVCAHEVAHLTEMNHSPRFWDLVRTLCPDYIHHRRWLKENGHTLLQIL